MPRNRKILLACAAVLAAGFLFIAFVLPPIVRSQLEKRVGQATGRACTVGKVSINPLKWSVAVRGVRLAEQNTRATFVSFSSLGFRVSPASLFRLAPVVNDLKLHAPYVHIVRTGPNRYNFTDIIERQPKKQGSAPARFSLNNIVIDQGAIDFEDLAPAKATRHTVRDLAVQLPFLSNISYFADRYVDPKVSAVVNGAPFNFNGKLKPFAKGMEATVKLNLEKLDIPYYAAYFPTALPLAIGSGTLSAGLEISHRLMEGGKPDLDIHGWTSLQGLALAEKSGRPLLRMKGLMLEIARAEVLKKDFDIAALEIDSPQIALSRDAKGKWNFRQLGNSQPAGAGGREKEPPAKGEEKPRMLLRSLTISNGMIAFRDELPRGGFATDLQDVELEVENLATFGKTPAGYNLSFVTSRGEEGEAEGNLVPEPLAISSRVSLTGLVLEAAYPYLSGALTAPVKGRADFSADLAFSSGNGFTMDRALLQLQGVQVPFGPRDFLRLPLVTAEGGSLKLQERSASINRITVTGGRAELSRDPAGKISTGLLLQPAPPAARAPARGKAQPPFKWKVGSVAISGFDAAFTDNTKEEKPRLALGRIKAVASSLRGPAMGEIPFTFASTYGSQGELAASGRILPGPLKLKGDLVIKRLPLLDFESYLPEGVNVLLLDGKLNGRLAVDIAGQGERLTGSFRGEGGIRDFHALDAEEEEDLLKWESLQLDGISGTLSPFSLTMDGVTLNNYYARVIINQEGRINLQDLYTPPAGAAGGAPRAAAAAAPSPPGTASQQARAIRVDSITLQDGRLNFADHHLNRDFATTMLNVGGRVTGLSSDASALADIDLRGNLENHSPLKITGKINPLRGDLFLDMTVNFSEIELSPLTPYSGTYLGYAIDKGKLSLALKYTVDRKKLSAENKVFLDQFTFGEQIESPRATSLPVRLAVSLLKDRKGEIHLDLPLSGRTDDPRFSVWGVIGQMLKNLLVKAATSPLSLLQSAFGGGGDFSSITFAPGTSHLAPAEKTKLRNLARALADRPGVKLEITGFADREHDPEGYRSELLLKKMKSEKFLAMVKEKRESTGLSADTMEILPPEQSRWLKMVYEKEKFPRPRTIIGTLKSLPDSEMRKLILANTVVGDQQLRQLARDRAVAVTTFLVHEGQLPQERLFEKSGDIFAPPKTEGEAVPRVEFGVVH